jgi:hypothetical protein
MSAPGQSDTSALALRGGRSTAKPDIAAAKKGLDPKGRITKRLELQKGSAPIITEPDIDHDEAGEDQRHRKPGLAGRPGQEADPESGRGSGFRFCFLRRRAADLEDQSEGPKSAIAGSHLSIIRSPRRRGRAAWAECRD